LISFQKAKKGKLSLTPHLSTQSLGGQVGDTGIIKTNSSSLHVFDTIKPIAGLFVHKVKVTRGSVKVSDTVDAVIDIERRRSIMGHHTATHLLQKALRDILGQHVAQAGSLVTPEYFRFDFTHFHALKRDELVMAEEIVNKAIRRNYDVSIESKSIEEARKIRRHSFIWRKILKHSQGSYSEPQRTVLYRVLRRHTRKPHRRHRLFQDHI